MSKVLDLIYALAGNPTTNDGTATNTPPQFDDSKKIATDEFVQRALGNESGVVVVAANRTMTAADAGKYLFSNANNLVYTLPDPSTLKVGTRFRITQGNLTSGGTINAPAGVTIGNITAGGIVSSVGMMQSTEYVLTAVTANAYQITIIGGQHSLTANGHYTLPNGLIVQWFTWTPSNTSQATLTFPKAFPNAFLAWAPGVGGTAAGVTVVRTGTANTTSIQLTSSNSGSLHHIFVVGF